MNDQMPRCGQVHVGVLAVLQLVASPGVELFPRRIDRRVERVVIALAEGAAEPLWQCSFFL